MSIDRPATINPADIRVTRMQIDEMDALMGSVTVSAETDEEYTTTMSVAAYAEDNLEKFLEFVRMLPATQQDIAISYYVLNVAQEPLGRVFGLTQTMCSSQTRLIKRSLGALILFGGHPSEEQLEDALQRGGYSQVRMLTHSRKKTCVSVRIAPMLVMYQRIRNFTPVAKHYQVWRPDMRKAFHSVGVSLQESPDPHAQAAGAWIALLLEGASLVATGANKRTRKKKEDTFRTDPDILGAYEVNTSSPDYDQVFINRASV